MLKGANEETHLWCRYILVWFVAQFLDWCPVCCFFISLNLITDWRNSGLWSQSAALCEVKSCQGVVALDLLTTK